MSTTLQPWYECTDDMLKVIWPTETVYSPDVKEVPDVFASPITKLLNAKPVYIPEMVILTHRPP